jgi:O-antigen ligase
MGIDLLILLLIPVAFLLGCLLFRLAPPINQINWIPAGCIGVLLVGSVLGHEFFHLSAGPIPITLDRLLLGGLIVFFGWQFSTNRENLSPLNRVDIAILVWMVMITVSTFAHKFTIMGNLPLSRLLFFNWLPVALYFVTRWCRMGGRDLKIISLAMIGFGLYLAFTGVAETRGMSGLVFPQYILESDFREFLGRGRGPFLNPVSNGIFMTVCICSALMWWPRLQNQGKALVLAASLVIAFGVYSTFTRSTWLGLVAGMGIFVFWPAKQQQKGLLIVVATLVAIVLFPVVSEKIFSFKRDQEVSQAEMEQSAQMRPLFASVAWDMFKDRPVFGVGFAQYPKAKYPYLQNPHSNQPLKLTRTLMQHNVFLAYLVDMGIVGLGVLLLLLTVFACVSWLVWCNQDLDLWARQFALANLVLLATYCINGMFHDVSIIPMQHALMFFWMGVVNNVFTHAKHFPVNQPVVSVPFEPRNSTSKAA